MAGMRSGPFIVGESKAMSEVWELIGKVAPASINVLIVGESGTGKELVARSLHHSSGRASGPFVPVNCAALPEYLVESELFGHERGAFSGAVATKVGKFEYADGGTLFLDEIGDMPLAAQAKMLRVLQEKELERIGSNKTIRIDARVVSATNKDPEAAVGDGSFREDLLYRLKGITIAVPPLRRRRDDIPLLVDHFISDYRAETSCAVEAISSRALSVLMDYRFPGNVRELRHIIQRAMVLAEGKKITLGELPRHLSGAAGAEGDEEDAVDGVGLFAALREITIGSGEPVKYWCKALRCIKIDTIVNFFAATNGEEFSRIEFAKFLYDHAHNGRNKYGTAGDYLPILIKNRIVVYNGAKANRARFRLSEVFLKNGRQS